MKNNFNFIIIFLFGFFGYTHAQSGISGELNPCPGEEYLYILNETYYGPIFWDAEFGFIVGQTANSVTIIWNVTSTPGSRTLKATFQDSNGPEPQTKTVQLSVNVKNTSNISDVTGDRSVSCSFRGTKTYAVILTNSSFPPDSYEWTSSAGWSGTSTGPSITYNINDSNNATISVKGYYNDCDLYTSSYTFNVGRSFSGSISGPSETCNSATFNISGVAPGTTATWTATPAGAVTVSSSGASATVTRIGSYNGNITLRADVLTPDCGARTIERVVHIGLPNTNNIIIAPPGTIKQNQPATFAVSYPPNESCELVEAQWEVTSMPATIMASDFPCPMDNNTRVSIVFHSTGSTNVRVRVRNTCGWSDWKTIAVHVTN